MKITFLIEICAHVIYNCVLGYSLTPPTLFFEVKMAPPFEHGFMTELYVFISLLRINIQMCPWVLVDSAHFIR
jgi:hypothetical protein